MNMLVSTAIAGTAVPAFAAEPDPIFAAIEARKAASAATRAAVGCRSVFEDELQANGRLRDHDRLPEDPESSRQVAHLCSEHRPDQWTGTRDGREVMTEDDVSVGRNEAIIMAFGRRHSRVVQLQDLLGDELAVKSIRDKVDADSRGHQPGRTNRLIAIERDASKCECAQRGYTCPYHPR
jgi:hypothetical protein